MAIKYTNRAGKTYYLLQGKTKGGKPRYFFSLQQSGKGKAIDNLKAMKSMSTLKTLRYS